MFPLIIAFLVNFGATNVTKSTIQAPTPQAVSAQPVGGTGSWDLND